MAESNKDNKLVTNSPAAEILAPAFRDIAPAVQMVIVNYVMNLQQLYTETSFKNTELTPENEIKNWRIEWLFLTITTLKLIEADNPKLDIYRQIFSNTTETSLFPALGLNEKTQRQVVRDNLDSELKLVQNQLADQRELYSFIHQLGVILLDLLNFHYSEKSEIDRSTQFDTPLDLSESNLSVNLRDYLLLAAVVMQSTFLPGLDDQNSLKLEF